MQLVGKICTQFNADLTGGDYMWVYETDEFKEAITHHNLGSRISECNESLESCQTRSDVGQRLIPRYPWYLYKKENFRLIGGIEVVGDRDVFVWYRILKRGIANIRLSKI